MDHRRDLDLEWRLELDRRSNVPFADLDLRFDYATGDYHITILQLTWHNDYSNHALQLQGFDNSVKYYKHQLIFEVPFSA